MGEATGETARREQWIGIFTGLLAGVLLALCVCLLTLLLGAALISNETVAEEKLGLFCLAGAFLGCTIGGAYAVHAAGRRALLVGEAVSLFYFAVWLAVGTGIYSALSLGRALPLLGASAVGGVAAAVLGSAGGARKSGKTKRK